MVYDCLRMALLAPFALLFTYIFLSSGMVVGVFSLLLLFIWPIAGTAYRKITSGLAFTVLGQIVWLCKDYANLRVHIFGEEEAYKMFGRDSHILNYSRRGDMDWIVVFVLGAYYKFFRGIRCLPKRSIRCVPGLGQLLWALEYPFLYRNNYQKDKLMITNFSRALKEYPFPVQVALFCEGTHFTTEKHERSLEFARKRGLPLLKHHLTPRTKGLALLIDNLRESNFKAMYDVAVAYPKHAQNRMPTLLNMFLRETVDIYWYMRRIPMESLPTSQDELNKFCYKMYQHKDGAYEYYEIKGKFPGPRQNLPPFKSTLWKLRAIMATWIILLVILPLSIMSVFYTPTIILIIVGTLALVNLVLFSGILIFMRGKNS